MLSPKQKREIIKIVQEFLDNDAYLLKEQDVQTNYTVPLLEILGWPRGQRRINPQQLVKTGLYPDILLQNPSEATLLVIESKRPEEPLEKWQPKLTSYCKAEGVYWGVLTNFLEWRVISSHLERRFDFGGVSVIRLCDPDSKRILIDDSAWQMFESLSESFLIQNNGRIDGQKKSAWYPEENEIRNDFFLKLRAWRKKIRSELKNRIVEKGKLNLETQKILDRLIFIKVCFDKGVIPQNYLSAIRYSRKSKYKELKERFICLNELFDSNLFSHDLCDEVALSNKLIEKIIIELNSIDFSNLNVHIIGEVYEDYLGELLDTKKRQGTYYTPEFIVNEIIENTLGKRLKKVQSLKELRTISVMDMACGSGSFLIGAFDIFYKKYKSFYGSKISKELDFKIKREILLNNLYGIDLDERAVQIVQLNLLLKAIEGTNINEIKRKRLLPDLSFNIRCGNSLITSNENLLVKFKEQLAEIVRKKAKLKVDQLGKGINENSLTETKKEIFKAEERINFEINKDLRGHFTNLDSRKPFNFYLSFYEIFCNHGFDVIVGNPPYGADLTPEEKKYFENEFVIGSTDTAILFSKRAHAILREGGFLGFIIPKSFCFASNYNKIREFLWDDIGDIIDCGKAWDEVKLEQIIFVLKKGSKQKTYFNASLTKIGLEPIGHINKAYAKEFGLFLNGVSEPEIKLALKIKRRSGVLSGPNGICENTRGKILNQFDRNGKFKVIGCKEIGRYGIKRIRGLMKENLAKTNSAIKPNSVLVQGIVAHITEPEEHVKITACIPDSRYFIADNINQLVVDENYSSYFIWSLLNSTIVNWYCYNFIYGRSIRTMRFDNPVTSRLPIPNVNFEAQRHFVFKSKRLLLIAKSLMSNESKLAASNIDKLADEIDEMVFRLYGLSYKDISIVEGHEKLIKSLSKTPKSWAHQKRQATVEARKAKRPAHAKSGNGAKSRKRQIR